MTQTETKGKVLGYPVLLVVETYGPNDVTSYVHVTCPRTGYVASLEALEAQGGFETDEGDVFPVSVGLIDAVADWAETHGY